MDALKEKKVVETGPFDLLLRLTVNIFNESEEKIKSKKDTVQKIILSIRDNEYKRGNEK